MSSTAAAVTDTGEPSLAARYEELRREKEQLEVEIQEVPSLLIARWWRGPGQVIVTGVVLTAVTICLLFVLPLLAVVHDRDVRATLAPILNTTTTALPENTYPANILILDSVGGSCLVPTWVWYGWWMRSRRT